MDLCINCKHLRPFSGGCEAFPNGIPFEFSNGEKEHLEIVDGQVGDFVFTQDPEIETDEDDEETKK